MNADMWTWVVPIVLVAAWLLFKRLTQVSAAAARTLVREGGRLIDVRSPGEFATGHLPGAINVPVDALGGKAHTIGPKDGAVVVYCASGARSAVARAMLKAQGFQRVFNLGAMSRWGPL